MKMCRISLDGCFHYCPVHSGVCGSICWCTGLFLFFFLPSSIPLLVLHPPLEGKEANADRKVKNILLFSLGWTSVSSVLTAPPTLTPPDGEPAGSAEVLPPEMAGITLLESSTLVFCTNPFICCCCWICHCSPYPLAPPRQPCPQPLWLIWWAGFWPC